MKTCTKITRKFICLVTLQLIFVAFTQSESTTRVRLGRSSERIKDNRHLGSQDEYLVCQLKQAHVMFKTGNQIHGDIVHSCLATDAQQANGESGMVYVLPKAFVQTLDDDFIQSGTIEIQGAHTVDDTIIIPQGAHVVSISSSPSDRSMESKTFGTRTVLALRITSLDSTNINNSSIISDRLFTGIGATISSVFRDCSWNALNMVPASGQGITNGVVEIFINEYSLGASPQSIENAATVAAQTLLPNFDKIDHVMYCIPAGTPGDWIAYGYPGWNRTIFNNEWCGFVSSAVHEIGHNLGLSHSSKGSVEYGDKQGLMGFSYRRNNAPAMCFNAHKHWVLGWYQTRSISVDLTGGSWRGTLVAFTDYDQAKEGEYVVVKVNNLYMQYNRAEKFNFQTVDKKNQLTIVEADSESSKSYVLAGIDRSNSTYRHNNFVGNSALFVEICSSSEDNDISALVVSIYLGTQKSSCRMPTPTPGPTGNSAVPFAFCFSGETTVVVKHKGVLLMKDLQLGDEVLGDDDRFGTVYSFGHRHETMEATFLQFVPSNIEVSRDHMVKMNGRYIPASIIKVGDKLETASGELIAVRMIQTVVRKGVYAPFTTSGTIIVSDIKASSYIAFQDSDCLVVGEWTTPFTYQWVAHASQVPHKIWFRIFDVGDETYSETGLSSWIEGPHKAGLYFLELNTAAKILLLVPAIFTLMAFSAIDDTLSWIYP